MFTENLFILVDRLMPIQVFILWVSLPQDNYFYQQKTLWFLSDLSPVLSYLYSLGDSDSLREPRWRKMLGSDVSGKTQRKQHNKTQETQKCYITYRLQRRGQAHFAALMGSGEPSSPRTQPGVWEARDRERGPMGLHLYKDPWALYPRLSHRDCGRQHLQRRFTLLWCEPLGFIVVSCCGMCWIWGQGDEEQMCQIKNN